MRKLNLNIDAVLDYKVENNIVEFTGRFPYWKHVSKSVVVDGVTYTNSRYEDAEMNVIDMDQFHFDVDRYDLPFLDYYMGIKDSSQFSKGLVEQYYRSQSTNGYVNGWMFLFDKGLIEKRVLAMSTIRRGEYRRLTRQSTNVPIVIHSYGFNNDLIIEISLKTFFSIKDKTLINNFEYLHQMFLQRFRIDINHDITVNKALKIINTIINEKQ
jgi:hypothetical protein